MPDNGNIALASELTVQQRRVDEDAVLAFGPSLLFWLSQAGELLPAWWSPGRDIELRRFWKKGDHLSSAVYTMVTKLTTMPFQVLARDTSVLAYQDAAERTWQNLLEQSEFGAGWELTISRFIEDFLVVDNGAFLEVIGAGDPLGPIVGQPVSISHLDATRCIRTGHPIYPVLFMDTDGKSYKMHHTRVIYQSQLSSPIREMNGVGFSAVSRAVNIAQNLIDIGIYKQEKLGSRPPRQLLIGQGITAEQIFNSFSLAQEQMDNEGFRAFSKTVAIGSKATNPAIDVKKVDLASIPDGFDEQTSITLGMYAIALAFGADARELWPATASGATKADAQIQHMKARGKGIGSMIQMLERQFNAKVLPPYLELKFDLQDDEQDNLRADITEKRSRAREKDLATQVVTVRVSREHMLRDGEIDQQQFDQLELADGRLSDGTDVLALFQNQERVYNILLDIGVDNPLEVEEHDGEEMIQAIDRKIRGNQAFLFKASTSGKKRVIQQAIAALRSLRQLYVTPVDGTEEDGLTSEGEMATPAEEIEGEEEATEPTEGDAEDNLDDEEKEVKKKQFDDQVEAILGDYADQIEALLFSVRDEDLDEDGFINALVSLTSAMVLLMFLRGANLVVADMTAEMWEIVNGRRSQAVESARKWATELFRDVKVVDMASAALRSRIDMWTNSLAGTFFAGMLFDRLDPFLQWVYNPLKEHCSDCGRLHGQVHRASEWRASGWLPRSIDLECKGFKCGCTLTRHSGPAQGSF